MKVLEDISMVGLDNIGISLLKPIIHEILPVSVNVFNISLNSPTLWKQAKVIPLPKKHNGNNVTDFRPISILHTLSKIIYSQVISHMNRYFLFDQFQSGFRKIIALRLH